MNLNVIIIAVSFLIITEAFGQGFYNRYSYRTKRHEITFGGGASSCLTDLGGGDDIARGFLWDIDLAKTNFTTNFSYLYNINSRIALRTSLSFSQISGDDALTSEFYRNNRRLNFVTNLLEGAGIIEWAWIKARTGSRYNTRSPAGRYLGVKRGAGFGFYVFGGIGGVYFDPSGYDRFIDENGRLAGSGVKYKLRPLQTEGKSYNNIAICVPAGFGIKKAFNSQGGIKLEAGYRFTNTDYLDDVSGVYYDWENNGGTDAQIIMSGTRSGHTWNYIGYAVDGNGNPAPYPAEVTPDPTLTGTRPYRATYTHTEPGFQRGNPENDDSYMFLTLSVYKKFKNYSKSYRTIKTNQRRKIKASF